MPSSTARRVEHVEHGADRHRLAGAAGDRVGEQSLERGEIRELRPHASEVAGRIAQTGVEAVAVCLLHSWSNPAHEMRMKALLADRLPGAFITASGGGP